MNRESTPFRHKNKDGKIIKVTRENGVLYIGNSDVPVGRNFKHFKQFHNQTKKTQGYDDWWQERNLDGSFAYNGVTDYF